MRLRVPELLAERKITAYELAKMSDGRISLSTAYRLANGKWKSLSSELLDALCDALKTEPGELFEREAKKPRKR